MKNVFIAHPRSQHSQQLAWALHEKNLLQEFWSGVPVLSEGEKLASWLPNHYSQRLKKVDIPPNLRHHPLIFQALWRAGEIIPTSLLGEDYNYRVFHFFDWLIAKNIQRLLPKAVIAYEDSAYHIFKAAKAIGARCILDAPSLHRLAGARLITIKQSPYLAEINRRKDEEVAMADLILTCSPLAAESYVSEGVPSTKVCPILLGAKLPLNIEGWEPHQRPLTFIFAGALSSRKAIDIILSAFKRLHSESLPYELIFVGGQGESGWIEQIEKMPAATYFPSMPQSNLYQILAKADCLLLPSRFDSFGMVVAEAMACGTPAIVSTQTGAKAIIEKFPNAGWVVGCDVDSLYQCVKDRILDRTGLVLARSFALEASRNFTWQAYRERVGQYIQDWMD